MEYLIAESIITENINYPSFPHEYELIINNWENVKNSVKKKKIMIIINFLLLKIVMNDMIAICNGFFKIWEK